MRALPRGGLTEQHGEKPGRGAMTVIRVTDAGLVSNHRPLDAFAVLSMLLLCLTWGFNQVAIKLVMTEVPPYLQALLRSVGGLLVVLVVAWLRGVSLFRRDRTLLSGIVAGLLFAFEFILMYRGLQLTTAARAIVFLYVAPFVVALGSYHFLGERLRWIQWAGMGLSFAGVATAIGVPQPNVDRSVLLGDLYLVGAGVLWAATTLVVKASALASAPAEKTLGYQLAVSVPVLALAAMLAGERLTHVPGPMVLSLLAFQAIWVAGLTFLLWFVLVRAYSASKLSAFSFITPLFGVAAGYLIMDDPLTLAFGIAAVLVAAGLYLVNRPARDATDPLMNPSET